MPLPKANATKITVEVDSIFSSGHSDFLATNFLEYQEEYERLVHEGQTPKALFISCSDSRVIPNLITSSKPGEIFVTRNVGAFVPPSNSGSYSVGATIEFAVEYLCVEEIIVCSHSHCGACASLYLELDEKKFPNLSCWLKHGKAVKEIVEKMIKDGEIIEEEKRVVTERVSCLQQLDNLLTYPCVKEKFEKGEIKLTAWYFTIEKGSLEYYDVESHSFKPLSTK